MKKILTATLFAFTLYSCNQKPITSNDLTKDQILSREEQEKLTPDEIIQNLKTGNKDFVEGNLTVKNTSQRIKNAIVGQYPEAVVLSCLDSRVPVEDVFNKGIGDIFVTRVAGNIVNEDILGSLEYACKVSGSKLVVVLGHEYCGAIKSSIDDVKLGYITNILEKITPAVDSAKIHYSGEKTSKNTEFANVVCKYNVINSINQIRNKSEILNEMEENNQIKIIGAIYDMETGKVDFI